MPQQRTVCSHTSRGRRGFTLVEALLACVILAMVTSAIVVPYAAGAQNDLANTRRAIAESMAQELMEEILAKPYSDPNDDSQNPGPEVGEVGRAKFDNLDDYDRYAEPAGSNTSDPLAAPLSRSVEVAYVFVNGQGTGETVAFCRVTVRVDKGAENLATLTRLVYSNE